MKNEYIIGAIVVAILLVGGYLFYASGPEVSAQGISSLKAEPDIVSVYLSIESKQTTAQAAKESVDKISSDLVSSLKQLGLSDKEIQQVSYNIYPWQEWTGGKMLDKGFVASQQILVKTKDFTKVAKIVDASIDSGALVSTINFELSPEKESEYKTQALELAGKDARKKAEATASGLGKSVGRLVSVQSQDYSYMPYNYYMKTESSAGGASDAVAVRSAALNLVPRELDVSATINVKYKLSGF